MKYIIVFTGVISMVLLTGCGSKMTAKECGAADWNAIGMEDANSGLPAEATFSKRQGECGAFNIVANQEQYIKGYAQGLITYCTEANGRKVGKRKRGRLLKNSICVGDMAVAFEKGYEIGRLEYLEEQRQKRLVQSSLQKDADPFGGEDDEDESR